MWAVERPVLSKAYKVLHKKVKKSDAKFEEKLTLGSKNDLRNSVNFNASSSKSDNLQSEKLLLLKVY